MLDDGLVRIDATGSLVQANRAAQVLLDAGVRSLLADLPLDRVLAGASFHDLLLARDLIVGSEQLLAVSSMPLGQDGAAGALLLLRDLTEEASLQARIMAAEQQTRLLARAGARLDGLLDLDDVLTASVELASDLLNFSLAWVALPNDTDTILEVRMTHERVTNATGPAQPSLRHLAINETLSGLCFNEARTILLNSDEAGRFYSTRTNDRLLNDISAYGMRTILLLPLALQGRALGVLGLMSNRVQHPITPADMALAEALAGRIALGVEHARLHGETRALQAFYQSVTSSAGLIFTLDRHLRLTWASDEWDRLARRLGMPDLLWSVVFGTSVVPLLPPDRLPELLEVSRQLLRKGVMASGDQHYQCELEMTLGEQVSTVFVSISPRRNQRGAIDGLTVSATNITHLKRLEAELRERHDELQRTQVRLVAAARLAATGELIAGVAHELNNPLTSVLGWAELMLDEGESNLDSVRRIHDGALRARRIVHGLLTFARQAPAERHWTQIEELAETVLDLKLSDFHLHGVQVHSAIATGLPPVWADGGQIQQVLLNLLSNADHAMRPDGGALYLNITYAAGCVQVAISDSGPGIPEAVLPRIFDPFFTTKPPGQGTGLGLAISHGIVRSHGGEISATNWPGGGARFTIFLPAGRKNDP
jgi:two-component system NtrC family sensor kinase